MVGTGSVNGTSGSSLPEPPWLTSPPLRLPPFARFCAFLSSISFNCRFIFASSASRCPFSSPDIWPICPLNVARKVFIDQPRHERDAEGGVSRAKNYIQEPDEKDRYWLSAPITVVGCPLTTIKLR